MTIVVKKVPKALRPGGEGVRERYNNILIFRNGQNLNKKKKSTTLFSGLKLYIINVSKMLSERKNILPPVSFLINLKSICL